MHQRGYGHCPVLHALGVALSGTSGCSVGVLLVTRTQCAMRNLRNFHAFTRGGSGNPWLFKPMTQMPTLELTQARAPELQRKALRTGKAVTYSRT